jgi:hypothetical protein
VSVQVLEQEPALAQEQALAREPVRASVQELALEQALALASEPAWAWAWAPPGSHSCLPNRRFRRRPRRKQKGQIALRWIRKGRKVSLIVSSDA